MLEILRQVFLDDFTDLFRIRLQLTQKIDLPLMVHMQFNNTVLRNYQIFLRVVVLLFRSVILCDDLLLSYSQGMKRIVFRHEKIHREKDENRLHKHMHFLYMILIHKNSSYEKIYKTIKSRERSR